MAKVSYFRTFIFCVFSGIIRPLRPKKKCKSCRSRQELSNEYLLAKIGFDTAENEPFNFHNFSSLQGFNFHGAVVSGGQRRAALQPYAGTGTYSHRHSRGAALREEARFRRAARRRHRLHRFVRAVLGGARGRTRLSQHQARESESRRWGRWGRKCRFPS